jgi:hypothetical protein
VNSTKWPFLYTTFFTVSIRLRCILKQFIILYKDCPPPPPPAFRPLFRKISYPRRGERPIVFLAPKNEIPLCHAAHGMPAKENQGGLEDLSSLYFPISLKLNRWAQRKVAPLSHKHTAHCSQRGSHLLISLFPASIRWYTFRVKLWLNGVLGVNLWTLKNVILKNKQYCMWQSQSTELMVAINVYYYEEGEMGGVSGQFTVYKKVSWHHRVPPHPMNAAKAGRNHWNTSLLPTGIGERHNQTVSSLCQAALLCRCAELSSSSSS